MIVNQAIPRGRSMRRWSVSFQVRARTRGRKRRSMISDPPHELPARAGGRPSAAVRLASRGSTRSSQRGSHQLRSPSSSIVAGTSTMRTSGGVEQHGDGQPEADQLRCARTSPTHEAAEHAHHDRRRSGDHPRRRGQAVGDGAGCCRPCGRTPPDAARAGRPRSPSTGRRRWRTASSAPTARSAPAARRRTSSPNQPHWKTTTITP